MRFTALVWKNLARRPLRSALTLLALSTAIAAVVALTGIARGFTRSFSDIYAAHLVDIVVSRAGSADRLSSSIDEAFAEKIANLAGVAKTASVLLETLSIEEEGVFGVPTMGIEDKSWLRDDYQLEMDQIDSKPDQIDITGTPEAKPSRTVWLGIHLAERLNVHSGGSIVLFDDVYQVTGVFKSPSTWENGSMILPLDELQRLTDRAGQATYVNVVLEPLRDGSTKNEMAKQAIAAISNLDPRLLPLATEDFVETDTRMQLAGAMAWMTSMLALVLGSIGTLNTMLTSVMERTKEIGILRAIGWPQRRVVSMILLESCGLAIVAGFFGTLLAIGLTWALAQAPAAKGILSPSIDSKVILQGFLLAIGIGLLGALLPAWRAARLMPTEAFRDL